MQKHLPLALIDQHLLVINAASLISRRRRIHHEPGVAEIFKHKAAMCAAECRSIGARDSLTRPG